MHSKLHHFQPILTGIAWLAVFAILAQSSTPSCFGQSNAQKGQLPNVSPPLPALPSAANPLAVGSSTIDSIGMRFGVVRGQPIVLFDGKTLDGWTQRNGQPATNWIVQDGAIYRNGGGGDLYHEHWYRDFELSFQWKLSAKGNSGVKYRVQPYGKQFLGCEYQVQDDGKNLFDKHATGSLYAVFEPGKNKSLQPVGSWNQSKIVVCGFRIEHWLNGEKVVDATVGSSDWFNRVQQSKFKPHSRFGENREGRIFLQDHGNPVWFREIVVVPLDSDNSAQSASGYSFLGQ